MEQLPSNIFAAYREISQKYPEKEIIYFKKNNTYTCLTYQDLSDQINKLTGLLRKNNIAMQQPVAIILDNGPLWPVAFLGLMQIGAIAVPLNPQLEKNELLQFLRHAETKFILTSENLSKKVGASLEGLKAEIIILDYEDILTQRNTVSENIAPASDINLDSIASLVYTSGTTATPKGVILTHRNLLSNVDSLKKLNLIRASDSLISILPFYHTYPFMVNLLLPLLIGARISFPANLDVGEIMDCIKRTKVSILIGVPRLFYLIHGRIKEKFHGLAALNKILLRLLLNISFLLRKSLSINPAKLALRRLHESFGRDFRFLVSGGAKLKAEVAWDFYKWGFTILEGYGLTETSPVVSFNTLSANKIGSVGRPIAGTEIKIDSPDKYSPAEILIKGDNVTSGYHKEDKLTQEAIKEGWFSTGDLGYLDKEGFLYIVGRKKEMLVLSSGKKIIPEDLENYYLKSRFIKEICIFLSGDLLTAVILPEKEQFLKEGVVQIKDRIRLEIESLSTNLPAYQRIQKYIIANESFERTILGKLKRYEIEAKYSHLRETEKTPPEILPQDQELLSLPFSQQILDYLSKKLKRRVNLSDHLELDLGLDSLARIEIFLEIQKLTGIVLEEEDIPGIFNVRDILEKLKGSSCLKLKEEISSSWKEILKTPLDEKSKGAISIEQSFLTKTLNIPLLIILKLIFLVFFPAQVKGIKNLPKKGPYLICPNHSSYLDGPALASILPVPILLQTYFLGFAQIFNHPLLRWLQKIARLVPIDPALNLTESLKACSYILGESKIICLFPEGGRSIEGNLREFKRGVGILIKELRMPVIPVHIYGTYQAWGAKRRFPHPAKLKIIFGEQLSAEDLTGGIKTDGDIYKNITDNLRERVIKLSS